MKKKRSLKKVIYSEYLKTSLIPILIIELTLLLMYFAMTQYTETRTKKNLLEEARQNIEEISSREVKNINQQFLAITNLTGILQKENSRFFSDPAVFNLPSAPPKFAVAQNGVFYKTVDNGGASLFYSTLTRIGEKEYQKALRSEAMDPLFKAVLEENSNIVGVYFNSYDSMNRYYPFLPKVYQVFTANMNIPEFNFYYLADAKHNPKRKPVWTDAYLDPAGNGWMVSCIVPIYNSKNFLEGVTGIDITIEKLVKNILNLKLPWKASAFLVDDNGVILAMPQNIENILNLRELRQQVYQSQVKKDTLKPEEFNLFKNKNPKVAAQIKEIFNSGKKLNDFYVNGKEYFLSQEIIDQTGWRMMVLVDKDVIYAPVYQLEKISSYTGILAFIFMLIFYAVFFSYLLLKSNKIADRIAYPIVDIAKKTTEMKTNLKGVDLAQKDTEIEEIGLLVKNFNEMTQELREFYFELEKKVAERTSQLEVAKEKAEMANKAKSTFLSNMSHEMRTPMNAILGYSQLMQRESSLSLEQREYLSIINRSGEHLLTLINDVLEIAKIEAQRIVLEPVTFDFYAMLRDLELMFRVKTDARGLQLLVSKDENVPRCMVADANKLRQILINLLGNAVKFTPKGSIDLRAKVNRAFNSQLRLRIEVEDTGIGIALEEMEKLFNHFEQTTSGKELGSGTGLGLVISREYARLMGGDITVTSQERKGSVFSLEVIIEAGQECDFKESDSPYRVIGLEPNQKGFRILVVDDKKENRDLLLKLLGKVGFEVREAVNGLEGLDIFEKWQPHLIWMDIRMPVLDGMEATRRIKSTEPGKSTVVVAITASAWQEEKQSILEAGFDGFVCKPYREQEIFQIMAQHLGVKYVYEKTEEMVQEVAAEGAKLSLKELPKDLGSQLQEAVLRLNTNETLEIIDKIIAWDAAVGTILKRMADNLDYEGLLNLLEGEKDESQVSP